MLTSVRSKWSDYYLMYFLNEWNNCRSTQRVFESRTSDQCLMFKKKNMKRIQIKKILGCRQQNSWTYLKPFVFQVFFFFCIWFCFFVWVRCSSTLVLKSYKLKNLHCQQGQLCAENRGCFKRSQQKFKMVLLKYICGLMLLFSVMEFIIF